jgi:reverse gyrase
MSCVTCCVPYFGFTPSGFGEHEVVNPLPPLPSLEREGKGEEEKEKKRRINDGSRKRKKTRKRTRNRLIQASTGTGQRRDKRQKVKSVFGFHLIEVDTGLSHEKGG